jgi:hypothetical protein
VEAPTNHRCTASPVLSVVYATERNFRKLPLQMLTARKQKIRGFDLGVTSINMAQGKTVPDIPGDARKLASTIGNAFDKAGKLSAHAQAQHIHC